MKVIIDSVVWSLALRRDEVPAGVRDEVATLVRDHRVVVLGSIRQEVLSGYSDRLRFERLRLRLSAFPNEPVLDEDYVHAAEFHNACRRTGIQGAHTDFLICACAVRLEALIYTKDRDFEFFRGVIPIRLYEESVA